MSLPAKKKQLTELQMSFLEHLFGDAQGDATKAKRMAGYDETTKTMTVVKSVAEEIAEYSKLYLATHSPRAVAQLVRGLDEDGLDASSLTRLKFIQEILNRSGITTPQSGDVNLRVPSGGIIILPAKEVDQRKTIDLQVSEYKEINDIYEEITDGEEVQ